MPQHPLEAALPAIRKALAHLPAQCRYHGDNTTPNWPGRTACCDTGEPAQARKEAEAALTTAQDADQ